MSISVILAILVTSIATFSSRFLGVVSSEGIKETTPKNLEEKVAIDVTKIARTTLIDI